MNHVLDRTLVLAVLMFGLIGCTNLYVHEFGVEPKVPGEQIDQKQAFAGLRQHLIARGMPEAPSAKRSDDQISFRFGSGRSGILRSPFEEYLELSYDTGTGFLMRLVRIIDHPVDFSRAQLDRFMSETEQFIAEALPNAPRVKVVDKATQPRAAADAPQAVRR
jgi:hypothetical protein